MRFGLYTYISCIQQKLLGDELYWQLVDYIRLGIRQNSRDPSKGLGV